MNIYWNTTSVILYRNRIILIDSHLNVGTITCHRFVDRVIDCFIHQVMKTFFTDVANIHCRAFAHGFKPFQHLNVAG